MLCNIPRLEEVAEMIGRQHERVDAAARAVPVGERDTVTIGAQLLHIAIEFDRELSGGSRREAAISALKAPKRQTDPALVDLLRDFQPAGVQKATRTVATAKLVPGMVLDEELRTKGGLMIVARGQEITRALLTRLENFVSTGQLVDEVRARVPIALARS